MKFWLSKTTLQGLMHINKPVYAVKLLPFKVLGIVIQCRKHVQANLCIIHRCSVIQMVYDHKYMWDWIWEIQSPI